LAVALGCTAKDDISLNRGPKFDAIHFPT
jgi:hypothetical protein